MINEEQCPAHTHTPWGASSHSYGRRLRQIGMGCLLVLTLTIFAVATYFTFRRHDDRNRSKDDRDDDYWPYVPRAPRHLDALQPMTLLIPSLGACGEQLGSCKASANENFCCPFATECRDTEWSSSGIYCCPDGQECQTSEREPPGCVLGTFQCDASDGGGCCPHQTTCSLGGCLRVFASTSKPADMEGAEDEAADAESSGYPSATEGTLVAPVTTIPTESVTHTIVKFGEVARIKNNNGGRLKCSDKVAVGLVLVTSAFLSWPL